MASLLGFIVVFIVHLGLVAFVSEQLGLEPDRIVVLVAVLLTLIVWVMGLLIADYILVVLALGSIVTLISGAGAGMATARGAFPGVVLGAFSLACFLATLIVPDVLEARWLVGIMCFAEALVTRETFLANQGVSEVVDEVPLALLFVNPTTLLVALLGCFLVLPVILPVWVLLQPALFLLAALVGFLSEQ